MPKPLQKFRSNTSFSKGGRSGSPWHSRKNEDTELSEMTAFAQNFREENTALRHSAPKNTRPMDSKKSPKAEDSFYSSKPLPASSYNPLNEESFQSFHRSVKKLQNMVVHNNTSRMSSPPMSPNIAMVDNMIHGFAPYTMGNNNNLGQVPSWHEGHFMVQGMPYGESPNNRQEHFQGSMPIPVTPYHPHSFQGQVIDDINRPFVGLTNPSIVSHEAASYYGISHPQVGSTGPPACYVGPPPWYSSPMYSNSPIHMPMSPRMQHVPSNYVMSAVNITPTDQQYYNHDLPVSPGPPIQTTSMNKGPDGANLFIFHIPNNFTNSDMYALFSSCGKLLSVRIMVEKDTGRSRGFGFVSYQTPEAAELAILKLNGYQVGNKRLKVQHKQQTRTPSENVSPSESPKHSASVSENPSTLAIITSLETMRNPENITSNVDVSTKSMAGTRNSSKLENESNADQVEEKIQIKVEEKSPTNVANVGINLSSLKNSLPSEILEQATSHSSKYS